MSGRPHPDPDSSLVADFADTIDSMRQLNTDAGMRPYRVFAVVVEHSGGEVGRGDPQVVTEVELLPTPLVQQRGIRRKLGPGGKSDAGYTEITELSPRYTEEQLQRSFHVQQLGEQHEAFYEIQMDRRASGDRPRRRYVLRDVPFYDPENHQWVIRLSAQDQKRNARGKPNKPERQWRQ